MALEQKLSLKLSQKLVMTPSLQQAIKLLQMTRLELEGALTQELVENPVLEEREDTAEEAEVAATATDAEVVPEAAPVETAERERDPMDEIDIEAYFRDYWDSSSAPNTYEEREGTGLENRLTREPDLYDHLLWQLHMSDADPHLRETCELLIGNLDPDGFLVASFDDIRQMTSENGSTPCAEGHVEQALAFLQSFDPPGVACRTLQECLLRQLEARELGDPALPYRVVRDHWELFLRRQFQALAKALDVPLRELEPAVDTIRALDTHPGRRFSTERAHYVEPDVMIVKVGDDYVIQLNDDGLPRLQVSKRYRQLLHKWRAEKRQSEAQQYIKEKMRSAIWLIKSLDQRQRTIYKVAESIVRQQRDFLDRGIDHLKPMVLRDVAEDISMHESTVSRVVSNKYIHTPRGLYPMKFFFHSGIDREYGDNISSLTVKRKIQQLIQGEDPRRPLSDSELMRVLNREGINIARRTVAKYRDELAIPSSTDRKQIF
ncbi:MAG TPA: RNA polymerase factor sigma-54 [Thermoanaerobaculia bacterium]|nr:RNA polymerase factor sigma-54 [Thermoanaerobaculia bacterium]